jgi:ketosteroid isomerase-like protein
MAGLDLEAFFRRYAELYMAGEAEAIAQLYDAPFVAVRSGRPVHLGDRAAVVEHLAGIMAGYRSSGAALANVQSIQALAQGDGALLATVHWDVRAADGSPVRDFKTSYQLAMGEGGSADWRIVSYVNHDMLRAR